MAFALTASQWLLNVFKFFVSFNAHTGEYIRGQCFASAVEGANAPIGIRADSKTTKAILKTNLPD
jgi:hypothetical protein